MELDTTEFRRNVNNGIIGKRRCNVNACQAGFVIAFSYRCAVQNRVSTIGTRKTRREVEQVNYAGKVSLDKIFAKWYRNKWLLKKDETLLSETSNLYPIYLWALAH